MRLCPDTALPHDTTGYNSDQPMDTDVPVPAGTCALRFSLQIDHRDATGFVYIGAKGVHPSHQPFTLAAP